MATPAENKEIVRKATHELAQGDYNTYLDACTDDVYMTWPGSGMETHDKEAARQMFEQSPMDGTPEMTESPYVAEGDTVAGYGTMKGKTKDGGDFQCWFGDFYTLKDGKITQIVSHMIMPQGV